jgi:hypothetical protein
MKDCFMKILSYLFIVGVCANGYATDTYLRNVETRLLYGPVDGAPGVLIKIPGGTYEVTRPTAGEISTTKILRSVVVPECNFKNAGIAAVGAFLGQVCSTNGLLFSVSTNQLNRRPQVICVLQQEENVEPTITVSAGYMTVFDLLNIIVRATSMPIKIDGSTITIGTKLSAREREDAQQALFRRIGNEASAASRNNQRSEHTSDK